MGNIKNDTGKFIISLDFELFWGVWDVTTREKYGDNIIGVQKVIPALLHLFKEYDIKATFATVGFLFAKNKTDLLAHLPQLLPAYKNSLYNVYAKELPDTGFSESDDPYHFGYSLLQQLMGTPHEISTHTFSHYYCLEEGQTAAAFDADIVAAKKIAAVNNIPIASIVFPRNQVNEEYLPVLQKNGINIYRGNPTSWIYKPRKFKAEIPLIRLLRLIDTYLPISGYNTHKLIIEKEMPVNVPASRFLKPYNKQLAWLEKLKLRRIMNEMTKAAQKKEAYHLWWHPHNFGMDAEQNLSNLSIILNHYKMLQKKYSFANCTMQQAGSLP